MEDEQKPDDGVDVLWENALEHWDDDKVHGALVEYAVRTENLPEVAGRYRALKDDPEKGARAKKQLDAIVVAATNMMLATKGPRPEKGKTPVWLTLTGFVVCLFIFLFLAYAMTRKH
jgi:hypothetical protein